jgi:hypothetical protein
MHRLIARQRLGKHIPATANARNRTSIARQRISKRAFSTIETLCFLNSPCRRVIMGKRLFEFVVVGYLVEFWRWQSKMIEKK